MKIEILGTGCPKCKQMAENAEAAVKALQLAAEVEKVTDLDKISDYGVMGLPALAVDGKIVSSGRLLTQNQIRKLIG